MTAFEKLIVRYQDDLKLCNCRQAYELECPGDGVCGLCLPHAKDHTYCLHGCSTNQLQAKEHVAKRMLKDLNIQ